ncbi:MAG: vWA domain-containing protein [Burkholderiaceae bacterium]|nr:vWA domain-containing protein [Burkholderiaceae bacterium]
MKRRGRAAGPASDDGGRRPWLARGLTACRAQIVDHLDRTLLIGAALALAASFLHPVATFDRDRFDQVIVFDITQSMNVTDYQLEGKPVSRLVYAKQALRQALLALPCGSKVGWGVFTEYRSFLLIAPVEVCTHLAELRATLDNIDGRMAWTGNSEVAKGLFSGIGIAKLLPDKPAIIFVTDGHESPPVNPRHRPVFNDKPGVVKGLIVGVGDLKPSPIPKFDPLGRPMGVWGADEVMQTDPRSQGRGGSVGNEQLAEDPADAGPAVTLPGSTPGSEHLSAMREGYLRLLADDTGLSFLPLRQPDGLIRALTAPELAQVAPTATDLRLALAAVAFVLLLARSAIPMWQRLQTRQRSPRTGIKPSVRGQ